MRFETYEEAQKWVLDRKKILVYYEPFAQAMKELGNPQDGLNYIHVAGTNGKGSTSRFLYDLCKTRFRKVGLYTSPHLENIRDRIRINNEWIPEEVFVRYLNEHMDVIERNQLGMVGICTMMCFLWFKEQQVDLAILEVSLGGRYDTTNVIRNPLATLITSIHYDHMEFFGDTIEEIAHEKAGIIKPGCPVITGTMDPRAFGVIKEEANTQHAPCIPLDEVEYLDGNAFALSGKRYEISSSAPYLKHNAALALTACKMIGMDLTSASVCEALKASVWPGRFEIVLEEPFVLLDGAHNPQGVEALCQAIQAFPHPRICVFSALKDKQGPLMRNMLEETFDEVLTTGFVNARADNVSHLGGKTIIEDWKQAVETAKNLAGEKGTVVITGSLYLISEVRAYLLKQKETLS